MDLIKFTNTFHHLRMEKAVAIPAPKSVMWVERYRDPSEFEITAPLSSGLREFLPLGTFISHLGTTEIMIVEDHQVTINRDEDPTIKITGRSLEVLFEQRVTGQAYANVAYPNGVATYQVDWEYPYSPDKTFISKKTDGTSYWLYSSSQTQDSLILFLINTFCPTQGYATPGDATDFFFPYLEGINQVPGGTPGLETAQRVLDAKYVYDQIMDLLKSGDLGLKIIRPGEWSPLATAKKFTHTAIAVHAGTDKSATIRFRTDSPDIESAEYLWSLRSHKNVGVVVGKWVIDLVNKTSPAPLGANRREMLIDGSIIDDSYTTSPNTDVNKYKEIVRDLDLIGKDVIASQKVANVINIQFSDFTSSPYKFGVDFNVGDIVSVQGEYFTAQKMRVTEYVQIEDETGSKAYPTLVPYP